MSNLAGYARVSTGDDERVPNRVGYARVSTLDQNPALQIDALTAAGCVRIFTDHASGTRERRPQLDATLDYLRAGDVLTYPALLITLR